MNNRLRRAFVMLFLIGLLGGCGGDEVMLQGRESEDDVHFENRLRFEKSPYLLQHAANPVDWYPWGEEAFEAARKLDRPIFLSIGYSTCHWCHVMEKESFEDTEVAGLMNESFVNIKVDREERPDIDDLYMTACQMITGSGGWPLTIIMTPDKRPFYAATYLPKRSGFGRIGMMELIPRIQLLWKSRRSDLIDSSREITAALKRVSNSQPSRELGKNILRQAFDDLSSRFDSVHGGFGNSPKFPTPHNFLFLLRYWRHSGSEKALAMVETTLQSIRRGGVFDHAGLGFHRYSTDKHWLLPHFEKMLYDQAMLAMSYAETFQATGNNEYRRTAEEILTYVLRDMLSPDGAFYSAEDADSEGEEGRFYLWSEKEIDEILDVEESRLVKDVFEVKKEGNFTDEATGRKTGSNILHLAIPLVEWAEELAMPADSLRFKLAGALEKLFAVREKRVRPLRDDKVLTDWNGLMIAALAKCARIFNDSRYERSAVKAAEFLLKNMRSDDGKLYHRIRDGEVLRVSFLDDYAFLIWGLLELYETTFEIEYLERAVDLNRILLEEYWDDTGGGFFLTPPGAEELPVRRKDAYDGAIPSGNSVAALNLFRLSHILGDHNLKEKALAVMESFSGQLSRAPTAFTMMLTALDFSLGPTREIVISGVPDAEDTRAMIQVVRNEFRPNNVVLLRPDGNASPPIVRLAPYTDLQVPVNGRATAYVCTGAACLQPVTDPAQLKLLLETVKVKP